MPTFAASTPLPGPAICPVRSGGHATAHAPLQVLRVPVSALNRYRVRPWESTRMRPRVEEVETPIAAGRPLEVAGFVDAVEVLPPQPAIARPTTPVAIKGSRRRVLMGPPMQGSGMNRHEEGRTDARKLPDS